MTTPLSGSGAARIDRNSFMAFAQPNAPEGNMPAPKPFGACQHPFSRRWEDHEMDLEGCVDCGKVLDPAEGWVLNETFVAHGKKAGVIPE